MGSLRTLKGQLALLGAMIAGAVVLAAGVATQRGWFEKFVREKYPEVPASMVPVLESLTAERVRELREADRLSVYAAWMTDERWATAPIARACLDGDAAFFVERARRTLVGGDPAQRRKAVLFLSMGRSAEAVPLLRRMAERSLRRGEPDLAAEMDAAVDRMRR